MRYNLTPDFRINFTAYAPLHNFKGCVAEGVEASVDIDFQSLKLTRVSAIAKTAFFTTGDKDRTRALIDYIHPEKFPEATVELVECKEFEEINKQKFRLSLTVCLNFMGIERDIPITLLVNEEDNKISIETTFKWSFKTFGLKAPRLLFLKVKDNVEISGYGVFNPS